MVDVKMNYKGKYVDQWCVMCKTEEETTEHLFRCKVYKEKARHNLKWNNNGDHLTKVEWLVEAVVVIDRMMEIRKRELNRQI